MNNPTANDRRWSNDEARSVCRLSASEQFFFGTKPVFLRRSIRATPFVPEAISEFRDLVVCECVDRMSIRSRFGLTMSGLRMLQSLPRVFVSGLVILLPVLLGGAMGVCG